METELRYYADSVIGFPAHACSMPSHFASECANVGMAITYVNTSGQLQNAFE